MLVQFSATSVHGHLTSKVTSPIRSPLLSPKLFYSAQRIESLDPVNTVTFPPRSLLHSPWVTLIVRFHSVIYIISEETSIFAPQRIPFYKDPRVAACTVGKVRSSTVFMCVCSTFRPSDFLLFVKNGFVVGVRCQGNREPPADGATTPLSQRHSWLGSP